MIKNKKIAVKEKTNAINMAFDLLVRFGNT